MNGQKPNFHKAAAIIYIVIAICLFFIGLGISNLVCADEIKPVTDCTYTPTPSDEVYYTCSEGATGTVEVKLWICGQPYTIDAKCPK